MFRKALSRLATITLLMLILLAGARWLLRQSSARPARMAAPAVVAFTGDHDLPVEELRQMDSPVGEITQYGATLQNGDEVIFDVEDDGVIGFFRRSQTSRIVAVTEATAIGTARRFAREHGVDPALVEGAPVLAELNSGDTSYQHYRFVWTERAPASGAYLPHTAQVTVNAETGQVDSFNYVNEAAQAAALETVQPLLPGARITERKLVVASVPLFAPDGTQALLWQIELQGDGSEQGLVPAATAFVDAATGDFIHLEPKY